MAKPTPHETPDSPGQDKDVVALGRGPALPDGVTLTPVPPLTPAFVRCSCGYVGRLLAGRDRQGSEVLVLPLSGNVHQCAAEEAA